MQTIQFLVLATAIAALIAGLNVSQVAHAQSKGTCVVGSNAAGNPTSNPTNGNPHCFDPEQQPPTATPPPGTTAAGCAGQPAGGPNDCSGGAAGNHPQSLNPQGNVVGNPHEEPSTGCQPPGPCKTNPQGDIVGDPHVPTR
jgi:hypothetical protein